MPKLNSATNPLLTGQTHEVWSKTICRAVDMLIGPLRMDLALEPALGLASRGQAASMTRNPSTVCPRLIRLCPRA